MGSVVFQKQNNRLGRVATGLDHISGLMAYCDVITPGFGLNLTITPGATSLALSWPAIDGATIYGYSYTGATSGAGTANSPAITANITGLTATSNYVVTFSATINGVVKVLGTLATRTGGPVVSATNRILELNSQTEADAAGLKVSTATGLLIKVIAYHISEFFRTSPGAKLFVGIFDYPAGALTFSEIATMRIFAQGKIRQIGVYNANLSSANVTMLQAQATDAELAHQPLEVLFGAIMTGVATSAFPDLSTMLAPKVHVIIGQDGDAAGKAIFSLLNNNFSITCLGAALGTMSLSKVSENIGWVEKFNVALVELDVPALSNGDLIQNLSDGTIAALEAKRYIFLKKYTGISGTYFNDSHGACLVTDDYAYAEDNRAMDKAIRGIYLNLVPKINGPVLLDPDTGQLRYQYVEYLKLEAGKALEQMERDEELSGYEVDINPDQNVNATSTIIINITNVKVGVSRNLVVKIGY